jgi:DNA replication protein DnaC
VAIKKQTLLPDIVEEIYEVKHDVVEVHGNCEGTGYISAGPGQVYRCDCMTVFRYLKELVKSRIPQDYWNLSLGDLNIDAGVKRFVQLYLKNMNRARRNGLGAVLFGSNGIGKTSVLCEVAKVSIAKGHSVRYFTLSSYIDAKFKKQDDVLEYYESGDVLLIDELDKLSGNISKTVDVFLRSMFNAGKSLFLATNWSEEDLIKALGESTASLLKRRCEFVEMSGDDYSEALQDDFNTRLTADFDYWHKNILKMAIMFEDLD